MRASIVVIWHTGQGGRWVNMMLRLDQAGARHSQSPVVARRGGDGTTMGPESPGLLVNIAHSRKSPQIEKPGSDGAAYLSPVASKNQAPVSRGPIPYGARRTSGRAAIKFHIVMMSAAVKLQCEVPAAWTSNCNL